MSEERVTKMGFERAGEVEQVRLGDCLWDVHAAGMKLLEFTGGRDGAEFEQSELLQSAAAMLLGIIADRLEQMRAQFPAEFAKATGASRVMEVATAPPADQARVWRVIEDDLPDLVASVRAVLEEWHGA